MIIQFPLGDWSDDGHGRCEYYNATCNLDVKDAREAHFNFKELYGFDIGELCGEYGQNEITEDQIAKLNNIIPDLKQFYDWDDELVGWVDGLDSLFHLWLHLLNHVNPALNLQPLKESPIPSIIFYGFDKDKRHLRNPGYGMFQ